MALSIGPNITGPILEYSTYHYNSLPYTAAAYSITLYKQEMHYTVAS